MSDEAVPARGQSVPKATEDPTPVDRIVRDRERQSITGVCRSRWWALERDGLAPGRVTLIPGSNRVGWRLSELLQWVKGRQRKDASR